jgi:hypothetical protein
MNDQDSKARNRLSFFEAAGLAVGGMFSIVMGIGAVLTAVGIFIFLATEFGETIVKFISAFQLNDVIIYIVSWILLVAISVSAAWEIRQTLDSTNQNYRKRRALAIGLIIGLVLTVILFKQPYLDALFGGQNLNQIFGLVVFATGAASGWMVWYLKEIRRYGDFFYILLLTVTIGLCWYARLTAPEPVQITAVAFVLGSLFRIAKDYMDVEVPVGEQWASGGSGNKTIATASNPADFTTQSANSRRGQGAKSKRARA